MRSSVSILHPNGRRRKPQRQPAGLRRGPLPLSQRPISRCAEERMLGASQFAELQPGRPDAQPITDGGLHAIRDARDG
jgi:hypothetical protein